jgi:RHS repeat-associated protein
MECQTCLYFYGARYGVYPAYSGTAWLCRFVSVDPLQHKYPYYTPYQYAGNKPVTFIDLDGLEPKEPDEPYTKNEEGVLKEKPKYWASIETLYWNMVSKKTEWSKEEVEEYLSNFSVEENGNICNYTYEHFEAINKRVNYYQLPETQHQHFV